MFLVQGYIDGVSYAVQVAGSADAGSRVGFATGNSWALAVLREHANTEVLLSPVGPVIKGDVNTADGVLAILLCNTEVTSVEGDDVPDLLGAPDRTVVY